MLPHKVQSPMPAKTRSHQRGKFSSAKPMLGDLTRALQGGEEQALRSTQNTPPKVSSLHQQALGLWYFIVFNKQFQSFPICYLYSNA